MAESKEKQIKDVMEAENKAERDQKYNKYVKEVTPKHNCLKNMVNAFLSGGTICAIGQVCINFYQYVLHLFNLLKFTVHKCVECISLYCIPVHLRRYDGFRRASESPVITDRDGNGCLYRVCFLGFKQNPLVVKPGFPIRICVRTSRFEAYHRFPIH